jgi:CelD/BcsL family acetyltransferase involved in cellulose biosynthesis
MTLSVDVLSSEAELARASEGWDDLVRAAPRPSPFMLHDWVLEWWRHYGDGAELVVGTARRDGRLVAALPLCVRRRSGLRVLEFLGGQASALGDLLLAAGEAAATARDVAAFTLESPRDYADLFGLPANSQLAGALGGAKLRLVERVEAPVLDLDRDWEAVYAAKTSSKKRNFHRRRRRQLAEQGTAVTVECARTIEELDAALEAAFTLHERRWSGRPDGSGFATPVGRQFNRAAMRALAEHDIPRIVTLKLDGRPVAFHYFFMLANRMCVYRLAFDPELAKFSPGLLNTLDAIEFAAGEGAQRVEFLGGDERYKLELADRLEPMYEGLGLAATVRGRLVVEARLAAIHGRRRLKRSAVLRRAYFEGLAPARRFLRRLRRETAST